MDNPIQLEPQQITITKTLKKIDLMTFYFGKSSQLNLIIAIPEINTEDIISATTTGDDYNTLMDGYIDYLYSEAGQPSLIIHLNSIKNALGVDTLPIISKEQLKAMAMIPPPPVVEEPETPTEEPTDTPEEEPQPETPVEDPQPETPTEDPAPEEPVVDAPVEEVNQ